MSEANALKALPCSFIPPGLLPVKNENLLDEHAQLRRPFQRHQAQMNSYLDTHTCLMYGHAHTRTHHTTPAYAHCHKCTRTRTTFKTGKMLAHGQPCSDAMLSLLVKVKMLHLNCTNASTSKGYIYPVPEMRNNFKYQPWAGSHSSTALMRTSTQTLQYKCGMGIPAPTTGVRPALDSLLTAHPSKVVRSHPTALRIFDAMVSTRPVRTIAIQRYVVLP